MENDVTSDSELEALAALAARAGLRWPRRRARTLDDLPKLRFDTWHSSGLLKPGRKGRVSFGDSGVAITFAASEKLVAFQIGDGEPRFVSLSRYRLHRGDRVLGHCPACHRRIATLYVLDGRLVCWRCTGLRPAANHRPLHDQLWARAAKLHRHMGGDGVPAYWFPPRPKPRPV